MTELPPTTEARAAYEAPAIVYESELEVRAGSPLGLPNPLDLTGTRSRCALSWAGPQISHIKSCRRRPLGRRFCCEKHRASADDTVIAFRYATSGMEVQLPAPA